LGFKSREEGARRVEHDGDDIFGERLTVFANQMVEKCARTLDSRGAMLGARPTLENRNQVTS